MAGESAYKEFDTSSIITNPGSKDVISIGKFIFRKREAILAAIATGALVGVLAMAIVLTVKASDYDSSSPSSSSSSPSSSSLCSAEIEKAANAKYCQTPECLQAALYQKPIINETVEPCTDFYTFACGQYAKHHEATPFLEEVTPASEIMDLNRRRLVYSLSYPVDQQNEPGYQTKLKNFMYSCDNHFDKMQLRGQPLIEQVIKKIGGWWVFDNSVLDNFDLQAMLEKVHIDYWAGALFNLNVKSNINNWNKQVVEFDFGGIGLHYLYYMDLPMFAPVHNHYKRYMHHLAVMLCLDAGVPPVAATITQFQEDAWEVEKTLAGILSNTYGYNNPHDPDNLLTLTEFSDHLNNTIDMVHYVKTLFNENPGMFDANTKVAIARVGYFDKVGVALSDYLYKDVNGKRKLHNYLMWRIIQVYARDLSWDYIHAERTLHMALYGVKDDTSGYYRCFSNAVLTLSEAVNAVFVKHFVKTEGKKEAQAILDDIKKVFLKGVDTMSWMSQTNRAFAKKKITDSLYKIGFPDQLTDDEYLNERYSFVDISRNDYFGNVIALHKLRRHQLNLLIAKTTKRLQWSYHVFEPVVEYYNPWSELIATSAVLQNPLFSVKGPAYYNYGGVGSRLATNLIHAIDEIGADYLPDGSNLGDWWSTKTREHYKEVRQCAVDAQKNTVIGPFVDDMGNVTKVNTTLYSDGWAPFLLSDASGIRLSYMAYKEKQKKLQEKLPPGFTQYNTDKMFFLSWAQSYCQNVPDLTLENNLLAGMYPSKNRVNLALKQVPEFHRAFDCTVSASTKQCSLFNLG